MIKNLNAIDEFSNTNSKKRPEDKKSIDLKLRSVQKRIDRLNLVYQAKLDKIKMAHQKAIKSLQGKKEKLLTQKQNEFLREISALGFSDLPNEELVEHFRAIKK